MEFTIVDHARRHLQHIVKYAMMLKVANNAKMDIEIYSDYVGKKYSIFDHLY